MAPLFILGFPRSGTTALASAVCKASAFQDFSEEGHFLYLFREALDRIFENRLNPNSVIREPRNKELLLSKFRQAINEIYSGNSGLRWIDKTPDIDQVRSIPTLRRLFPQAKYIYLYRDVDTAVVSNVANWPQQLAGKELEVAQRWSTCNKVWRDARHSLEVESYLEIYQKEMLRTPEHVARQVCSLLDLSPQDKGHVTEFLIGNKSVNRPHGDHAKKYDAVTLTPDVREQVFNIARDELRHWPKLTSAPSFDDART